jgi:hypothetical protein
MRTVFATEQEGGVMSQKLYTFTVTLVDSGLPYNTIEEAKKDADEWAKDMAATEDCQVASVVVREERSE